jgi:DNA-binding MarR family transcriptional regulator
VKHPRDETGHWLAGLSDPMVAMREFLESHEELQRRQAKKLGMHTTDMQALRLLDVHGPLGPTELGQRLDLRSASVTVLLDRLESGGLVERIPHERDRRRIVVRVLPRAAERLFDSWAPIVRAMDDAGHQLAVRDQRAVCAFFDRITEIARAAGS